VLAAAGLIGGFAVAKATGSRPLGGVVLVAFGLLCIGIWLRRDGRRTAARLTVAGLVAFALSHALGPLIGAWPAVILVAAATATLCWRVSDRQHLPETRDRADTLERRAAVADDQDRLDPRRAGTGNVLLDAVADVNRLGRADSGQPQSLGEDRRSGLARSRLGRREDAVEHPGEARVTEHGVQ
jgi:hypothetical protein